MEQLFENEKTTLTVEEEKEMREKCEKQIAISDALNRLKINPDFQLVFLNHYASVEESNRLVNLFGEDSFNFSGRKAEHREDLHERIIAISRFNRHMRIVDMMGDQARNDLEALDKAKVEYSVTLDIENENI